MKLNEMDSLTTFCLGALVVIWIAGTGAWYIVWTAKPYLGIIGELAYTLYGMYVARGVILTETRLKASRERFEARVNAKFEELDS